MADNSTQTGNDTICTDDLATINGGAVGTAQKVQRVKVGYGVDGDLTDASTTNPLPVAVQGTVLGTTSANIAAAGTGTIGPLNIAKAGNVTFVAKNQTAASAWAGSPVLVFEQSDDSTSWTALPVLRQDNGVVASTHTLPANAANQEFMFDAGVEGSQYVRCRVTTGPTTNPMTVAIYSAGMPFMPMVAIAEPTRTMFSAATVVAGVTAVATEALLSMVPVRDGVAAAAATSFAVTAGKKLRLQSITVGLISTAAAVISGRFVLRINPSGAAAATSPIVLIIPIPSGAALAQAGGSLTVPLPDCIELSGAMQFGLTQVCSVATGTVWATVNGTER
jgi:hypothetical protein